MKELTMKYVTTRLMHEMSKRKEREPQSEDVAMVSHQSKASDPPSRQGVKMCFHCSTRTTLHDITTKQRTKRRKMATM